MFMCSFIYMDIQYNVGLTCAIMKFNSSIHAQFIESIDKFIDFPPCIKCLVLN